LINDIIIDICDLLDIDFPAVSYDTSHFTTETMMAQADVNNNIIYIRHKDNIDLDYIFFIAHELRHLCQASTDREYYFANYKTSDKCESVEEYNLQIAEIDAHAFAGMYLIVEYNAKPLFKGLSDKVKNKIYKRIEKLKNFYYDIY
jgi:Zn-dependent peptidase ImmA (M78 family)